jgi:DHA2 family multidrug resistance protein-like MFS transporter
VGLAGTPASHSLTGSVPVTRAGMASGTADLQRDLGGAILQSVLGALLSAGYAAAFSTSIASAPDRSKITSSIQDELEKSFSGAAQVAHRYPQYASKIIAAARSAFLSGDQWAYTAGIAAVLIGAAVVCFLFPGKDAEERLLARYHAEDQPHEARVVGGARKLGQQGLREVTGAGIVEQCRHAAAAPTTPPWPVWISLRPRPAICTTR